MREQQFNNNHKIYIKMILLCAEKLKKNNIQVQRAGRAVVNVTVPTSHPHPNISIPTWERVCNTIYVDFERVYINQIML